MTSQPSPTKTLPCPPLSPPAEEILIIGLGSTPGDLSLTAWYALLSAETAILPAAEEWTKLLTGRTRVLAVEDLALSGGADATSTMPMQIARRVLERAVQGAQVAYGTPVLPPEADPVVGLLQDAAAEAGLRVRVFGPSGALDWAWTATGINPLLTGGQVFGAAIFESRHHPPLDVSLPALITGIGTKEDAAVVARVLRNAYPPDHPLAWIAQDKAGGRQYATLGLDQLSQQQPPETAILFVPAQRPGGSFTDLLELIAHLRAPDGCPWDQEQTLDSLREFLLDETCEVLEAMDAEDDAHTAEELGDLLGIIAMIGQVAVDENRFFMADAVRSSVEKLTRRHPHVFGEVEFEDMAGLYRQWDAIKAQERAEQGKTPKGPLDNIPASLPALKKAQEMQSKAQKAGLLDRSSLAKEEPALADLLPPGSNEIDLGRLLWRVVALAKERGLNPEDALRRYAVQFRASVQDRNETRINADQD